MPLLRVVLAPTALVGNPTTSNPASTKPSAHHDFGAEPLQVKSATEEVSRMRRPSGIHERLVGANQCPCPRTRSATLEKFPNRLFYGRGRVKKDFHGSRKYAGKPHGDSGGSVQRFPDPTAAFGAGRLHGRLDGQSPAVGLQKRHQPRTFPSPGRNQPVSSLGRRMRREVRDKTQKGAGSRMSPAPLGLASCWGGGVIRRPVLPSADDAQAGPTTPARGPERFRCYSGRSPGRRRLLFEGAASYRSEQ